MLKKSAGKQIVFFLLVYVLRAVPGKTASGGGTEIN